MSESNIRYKRAAAHQLEESFSSFVAQKRLPFNKRAIVYTLYRNATDSITVPVASEDMDSSKPPEHPANHRSFSISELLDLDAGAMSVREVLKGMAKSCGWTLVEYPIRGNPLGIQFGPSNLAR